MSGARIILLFAMCGGAFAAYRYGYLDDLAEKLGLPKQAPADWPGMGGDREGSGGNGTGKGTGTGLTPIASDGDGGNLWSDLLDRNKFDVAPWAWANRQWVAALMKVESGSIGPSAVSSKGALGLMQVMPGTATEIYNRGYRKYPATSAALATEAGGIYFGTSYLQYLSGIKSDREWITKAYYGGPGWEGKGAAYRGQCEEYLDLVENAYANLYGTRGT